MKTNKDEKKLIESIEKGEWRPVRDGAGLKKKLQAAVKTTMLKDQRMNIRIAKKDLEAH